MVETTAILLVVLYSSAFELSHCFGVITLWQVKCIWYVQYRIMTVVREGKSSIWQAVNISLWKQNNHLSIVRGSMVRGNLHHKISHNIENYLQWEKKKKVFLFLECWFHGVNCQSECFWHQSMPKPSHGFFNFFILFYFSVLVKQLGVQVESFSSSAVCHRVHCVSSWCSKLKTTKTISTPCWGWPRLLNSSLFSLFFFPFFFALLKGSFPTQFF